MLRGLMMRPSGGLFGLRSFLRAMTAITVGCTDISLGASEPSNTIRKENGSVRLAQAWSIRDSTNQNEGLRLGIQTQKNFRAPEPLRRNDCATDDECEDYSWLPKSEPPNTKNAKMPFLGLSITASLK
jgi:hypothetical protein